MKSSSTAAEADDRNRQVVQTIAALLASRPGRTIQWYAGRLDIVDVDSLTSIIDQLFDAGLVPEKPAP